MPWGLTAKGFFHCFLDDSFSNTYGYEIDAALEKKISEDMSVLLTGALFFADEDNGFNDIQQFTLGMDFNY